MDSRSPQQAEEELSSRRLRSRVGLILIGLGVAGILLIAERIIALAADAQGIPLIARFLAYDESGRSIVASGGSVVLPEGLYLAVGLFLYILALWVFAGLARALLTAGAHLMGQEFTSVAHRLREEMARLKEYLENRNK
jgi:fatty acid desaturase